MRSWQGWRALVSGAASTADLVAAENALSTRQADLDSLTARKRHLDEQISLSTVTIDLSTDDPTWSQPDSYWDRVWSRAGIRCSGVERDR
jgi:hypothetical protein